MYENSTRDKYAAVKFGTIPEIPKQNTFLSSMFVKTLLHTTKYNNARNSVLVFDATIFSHGYQPIFRKWSVFILPEYVSMMYASVCGEYGEMCGITMSTERKMRRCKVCLENFALFFRKWNRSILQSLDNEIHIFRPKPSISY